MYDYLEYVRNSGQYESSFIETELEFNKDVKDAIEISIKIAWLDTKGFIPLLS